MRKILGKTGFISCLVIFLTSTAIFSGWQFYKIETACVRVPVGFSDSNLPTFEVLIEGIAYTVEMDLGSKADLMLTKNTFMQLNKKPEKMVRWRDAKGNPYETAAYLIKKVTVKELKWSNLEASEMNLDAEAISILKEDPNPSPPDSRKAGRVGLPFLRKANICLDFSNKAFFFCNSLKELHQKGIFPKKFSSIPFHFIRNTVVIQAETVLGTLNLGVDTGCTVSLVKAPLLEGKELKKDWRGLDCFTTSHFIMGGNDFGKLSLYSFPIAPQIREVDGLLGMDFLKKHVIYIDYRKQLILIGNKDP